MKDNIGRNAVCIREVIANSRGNAIAYNNHKELIESMSRVAESGIEKYHDRILAAQKIAEDLYAKSKHAKEVLDYYYKLIGDR